MGSSDLYLEFLDHFGFHTAADTACFAMLHGIKKTIIDACHMVYCLRLQHHTRSGVRFGALYHGEDLEDIHSKFWSQMSSFFCTV